MLTQDKPKIQVSTSQYQAVAEPQVGVINPSRSITPEDEVYLRDYALAAFVLSWDECTYGTPEQITAADITNIAISEDTVWYQIQLHRAIPINIETFHAHRLQIQQHSCYVAVVRGVGRQRSCWQGIKPRGGGTNCPKVLSC